METQGEPALLPASLLLLPPSVSCWFLDDDSQCQVCFHCGGRASHPYHLSRELISLTASSFGPPFCTLTPSLSKKQIRLHFKAISTI